MAMISADTARVIDRMAVARLIAVVELPSVDAAEPLAAALVEEGMRCVEVTLRTEAAVGALRAMRRSYPDLLLGAGTVLSAGQASDALDAGADFVVSPGLNPAVVDYCQRARATIIPGVCTPTEIEAALGHGLDVLKFFPAEAIGGVPLLRAFAGPYPHVRFIPTGGIDPSNVARYLAIPTVLACGGSWMVRKDLIAAGDYGAVRRLTAEAVALARSAAESRTSGSQPAG